MTAPDLPPPPLDACRAWLDARPEPRLTMAPPDPSTGRLVLDPSVAEPIGWVAYDDPAAVDAAVTRARAAFDSGPWPSMGRRERARVLQEVAARIRAAAPELAALQSMENGKTYRESLLDDLPETAEVFDYYAGWTDKLHGETNPVEAPDGRRPLNYTVREPVGVCALVVPWNFPLLLAAWKISAALAMGNTAIVKPSEFTPLSTLRLLEVIGDALPPGVLQAVVGGPETGHALVTHPRVSKVSFTGSTPVGRSILADVAGSNLATVTLELGGNAPFVVLEDVADVAPVVDRAATVLFSQKGEKCTEPARFLVHERHHDAFVEGLAERAAQLVCGAPFDPATTQGAQCTEAQFHKVLGLIDRARHAGARVVVGGQPDARHHETGGWFIEATVLDGVGAENPVDAIEVFGPVAKVSTFATDDEALARANGTEHGLAAGVYSDDVARARRFADRLDHGQVFVNRYGQYDLAAPFGGFKGSGWGKELGQASLDAYTRRKSIWLEL